MAFDTGSKTVTGTAAQVEGTAAQLDRRVKTVEFFARSGNGGPVYVGSSGVTATDGRELVAGASLTIDFDDGSEIWGNFFVVAGTGSSHTLDWTLVFED